MPRSLIRKNQLHPDVSGLVVQYGQANFLPIDSVDEIAALAVASLTVDLTATVRVTGEQLISGLKTFATRPIVNGSGVMLSGEVTTYDHTHPISGVDGLTAALSGKADTSHTHPMSGVTGLLAALSGKSDVGHTHSLSDVNNLISALSGKVDITGNQNIWGVKTFEDNVVFKNNLLYTSQPSGHISGNGISGLGYTGYYDGGIFLGNVKIPQHSSRLDHAGASWIPRNQVAYWTSMAISSDGKYITATSSNSDHTRISISDDYGNTWSRRGDYKSWWCVAMSSDGKYQMAGHTSASYEPIHISSDYGNSWVEKGEAAAWSAVAMSSDGRYQIALGSGAKIRVSTDFGETWAIKTATNEYWSSASMSSDGRFQTALVKKDGPFPGKIYTSNDYGNTWTVNNMDKVWEAITVSSDGRLQTAVAVQYEVFISVDYGVSWNPIGEKLTTSYSHVDSVSMSSDGKYQIIGGGYTFLSSNYGYTWTEIIRGWEQSVAISSNGKYIAAGRFNGQIYISAADEIIDGSFTADSIYGSNLMYNTGNQLISGQTTFASDIELSEITGGIIMRDLSGYRWRINIDTDGELLRTKL